jgi:hypothetical protein
MDKLDKLNNLIAQVSARIEQIDETTLNESQKNVLEMYKTNVSKKNYETYHNTYTSAINTALEYAERNGYTYNADETAQKIGFGPKKPDEGVTNRFTITLFKNGIEQKKALQIQVYGMRDKYELNCYIA